SSQALMKKDGPAATISLPGSAPANPLSPQGATRRHQMFTQFLGSAATAYGVLAGLTALLQTRRMLARRTSCDVSARFLASYASGYAIWLTYGLSTGSLPLIVVDTVGLLCGGLMLTVALSLRGSLIRPATWNSCEATSLSHDPQPQTSSPTSMPR